MKTMFIGYLCKFVPVQHIFLTTFYCDFHPIFIVLWPFIALAKDALRQVCWGRVYGPSPTF
jgi:hypothetical protein